MHERPPPEATGSAEERRARMARKRRIVFVEQFYYPDGWGGAELPLDLTIHLAGAGYEVEVICGADQYAPLEGASPRDPRASGVRIRRIPALLRGNIQRAKLLRQIWFYVALVPLLLLRRPPDLFVAQTNPPLAVILVCAVAQLWRKPLVIIAMDIYPEVLFAHGTLHRGGALGKLLQRAFDFAYRRARRVVALGPVMAERLEAKGVTRERIVEISNWATGATGRIARADNALQSQWSLEDKFVLLYSGNLGLAHEFNTLLEGVKQAANVVPSLRVIFIGRGKRLAEVRRRVGELAIDAIVRFSDLLPAERLPESFGIAHLAIVTLQPGFEGLVVPSKLQGYMARGVPVLYVGPDSDIERFLIRSEGGVCVRTADAEGVAACLIALAQSPERLARLGANAGEFYNNEFTQAQGLTRYESLVRSIVDVGASA